MLVLSRRVSERLVIGRNVVITISGIHGSRVRLGIQAPIGVRVVRGERTAARLPQSGKQSGPLDLSGI